MRVFAQENHVRWIELMREYAQGQQRKPDNAPMRVASVYD
jgi:hypothetical protein